MTVQPETWIRLHVAAQSLGYTHRHAKRLAAEGKLQRLVIPHPTEPRRNRVLVSEASVTAYAKRRKRELKP